MPTMQTLTPNTQTQPLVSFILTCYNLELELLRQCIDSILALSLRPEERQIILVDDGSDTSPLDDLQDYGQALLYLRQHNQGLSVARNEGLKLARGRYIQFVDGDDYLITDAYESCLATIRAQEPDLLFFRHTSTQHASRSASTPFQQDQPVSGCYYLRHRNLRAAAWGYLFRHAILGQLAFTPGILHEDEDFTPRLLLRADTVIDTDMAAYYYRQRAGSIINHNDKEWRDRRFDDTFGVICRLKNLAARSQVTDRQALERRVAQLTMDYIYNVCKLTRSYRAMEQQVDRLRHHELFPLPDEHYTPKYVWFRRLSATKVGRMLLFQMIR